MSDRPAALLVGDPHISRHAWASRPEIRGDAEFAISELLRLTEHYQPQGLILLGDVFDSYQPCPEDLRCVLHLAEELARMQVALYFLRGQHDLGKWSGREGLPWVSLARSANHAHRLKFTLGGVRFFGLDFCHQKELRERLLEIPEHTDVLLAHQVWQEHMPPGAVCEAAFAEVPHVRIVATGDMHGHRCTMIKGASGQILTAMSPGTLTMQSIDEDGAKFVYLLYSDLTYESIPLDSRPLLRGRLQTELALERFLERITSYRVNTSLPGDLQTPLIDAVCLPGLTDARARLEEAALGRGHLFYSEIKQETEEPRPISRHNYVGVAMATLVERRDPELAPEILRLAGALDPDDEVRCLLKELRQEQEKLSQEDGEETTENSA